jgi:hypothetical protein
MEATVSATPVNATKPLNKLRFNMRKAANDSRTSAHESTEGVPAPELAARRLTAKVPTLPKELHPFAYTAIEQLYNKVDYVRPGWAKDRRQSLDYQIEKSLARLGG